MRLMDRLHEGHNRHHPVESIEELFQLRNQASFLLVTEGSLLLFFVVLLFCFFLLVLATFAKVCLLKVCVILEGGVFQVELNMFFEVG